MVQVVRQGQGLALAAKAAGEKAAADAVAAKEIADAGAVKAKVARAKVAPIRVGGRIQTPNKIKDVKPVYPAIAQSARVSGAVTIEATIGPDGKVADANVCARSRSSIRRRLMPCGNGSTRRPS